jgi:16S rRNA (guanine(966)-N(2))-methyltransferase RsmD
MMRIIAGTARGRRLVAPRGPSTRPTSDKVRAALFNVLGQYFEGGDVLDLYAGSGALALEALSRGCSRAVCVEGDAAAVRAIRRNAEACGFADRVEIRCEAVERALARLPRGAFALAFADPPYAEGPEVALAALGALVAPGGRAVAEHDVRRPPAAGYGPLQLVDRRAYGSTGLSIYAHD